MRSIWLFLTNLLVTLAHCEEGIPNFKLPQGIDTELKPCNCICTVQEDNNRVPNEVVIPVTTACPKSLRCQSFCDGDCFEMANGACGINYGFRVNLLKGVTCLSDDTTENFDYYNCTNYKNTIPSSSLTNGCRDYCEGTVDPPKKEILCTGKKKSSDGTVSDGTKRCNCKCMKQEDNENPLVVQACPQNFNKTECEEFCTEDCPRAIKNKEGCQNIYGFMRNDRNGVTCIHDGKTKKKYEFDNCTNYENAIPSQSLTNGCEDYCAGTAKFPENKVICTVKKEVPMNHDEL